MPVAIPVAALRKHCNPYASDYPWGVRVRREDVDAALREGRLVDKPDGEDHAGRIAYLVRNRASDPISIDVGCPALGYWGPKWMVVDGNHRLAAAIYRGDFTISALVDGQLDWALELFGVDCSEPVAA